MGADLCGSIVVGPRWISDDAKKRAIVQATDVVKAITKVDEAIENDCNPEVTLTPNELRLVKHVCDLSGVDDWADLSALDCLDEWETPEDFVREFVAMWELGHVYEKQHECYRDCMCREFINPRTGKVDQNYRIFVAGERTWGDGAEAGSAQRMCQCAEWLNIMGIMGLC